MSAQHAPGTEVEHAWQAPDSPHQEPWLSLVGVGADGADGLTPAAASAIARAELVIGSARQLACVSGLIHGRSLTWPSPLSQGISALLERRGRPTCVLGSGDPFFYGIGATLARELSPAEFICHPAPSSLSLAAARLGWALQDVDVLSLHGRELTRAVRYLQPGRRLLVLSWNGQTPAELARLLAARGFGPSRLSVLERLGAANERQRCGLAQTFDMTAIDDLNLIAVELRAEPGAFSLPCRASLPDACFENDGQLTKREVRAITLSALEPHPGQLLWDVGAGSGSIAIEWMLSHPACRAVAIERDPARAERIRRNAERLGVPELEIAQASAPEALADLAAPDAVFVGGGASSPGLLDVCIAALASGGRLVVNSVCLETEALLIAERARRGGELLRLAVEHAAALGELTCFRPALPIVQWRFTRP